MNSRSDIEKMADIKLEEATCLLANQFWDGAYYLAGYSVELLLKARICKILELDDFFIFKNYTSKELYKPFKVHDYKQLAILCGLYPKLLEAEENETVASNWSAVSEWSENSRYTMGRDEEEVTKFINSVKRINKWIKEKL